MKAWNRIAWDILLVVLGAVLCVGLLDGLSIGIGGEPAQAQKAQGASSRAGGEEETGPDEVAMGWPQPLGHPGFTWGAERGVFAETLNRIYIANRVELPIPEKAPESYT